VELEYIYLGLGWDESLAGSRCGGMMPVNSYMVGFTSSLDAKKRGFQEKSWHIAFSYVPKAGT
jgi:hypothetical protein